MARSRRPGSTALAVLALAGLAGCVGALVFREVSTAHRPVVEVVAGDAFTCLRASGGRVACCGNGWEGQLGNGASEDEGSPQPVRGMVGAEEVVAGGSHACARQAGGIVSCWGAARWGQLGALPADPNAIAAGRSEVPLNVPIGSPTARVAAGDLHTCALVSGGGAWCWGRNHVGQLGTGATAETAPPAPVAGLQHAVALAVGSFHTCAIVDQGGVLCWGANDAGQVGDADLSPHLRPAPVAGLAPVSELAAGNAHTCARLRDGGVSCWGAGALGQLGEGPREARVSPVTVPSIRGARQLRARGDHTCAVLADDTVRCWGGSFGRLALRPHPPEQPWVDLAAPPEVASLAVGESHACVLTRAGKVWCTGDDVHGQLCDGSSPPRSKSFPPPG
jgi:alpha-tubulin suppressor-like RCC1 family protein